MHDCVITNFKFINSKGFKLPPININYNEINSDVGWTINCGGTRGYLMRFGNNLSDDFDEQAADSHFMVNRITTSLLLCGAGLFRAEGVGRIFFHDIKSDEVKITNHLDLALPESTHPEGCEDSILKDFVDWFQFICSNTLFRRAADDAYYALINPVEADFFIYRGMEWLIQAANIGWKEIAEDIGVNFKDIREFKKQVNADLGQRHGIKSGRKSRINIRGHGSLIADFIHCLGNTRKRVDEQFIGIPPSKAAKIVSIAMDLIPYL